MSAEIDWVAALSEVEEKIVKLQNTADGIRYMIASSGNAGSGVQRISGGQVVPSDAFLALTISDAAKKYLEMVRSANTIAQIWEALKQGGLPHIKYNAVYTAIWRREFPNGEFARPDERNPNLVGLAEWYPTNPNIKKRQRAANEAPAKRSTKKPAKRSNKRSGVSLLDGTEKILREANQPLHISILIPKLTDMGRTTNVHSMSSSLRQDSKKRFTNLGRNTWALTEWPDSILKQGNKEAQLPL